MPCKGLSFCSQQQPSGQAAWNHAGLPESVLTGDGRFDSVKERLRTWQPIEGIEDFHPRQKGVDSWQLLAGRRGTDLALDSSFPSNRLHSCTT